MTRHLLPAAVTTSVLSAPAHTLLAQAQRVLCTTAQAWHVSAHMAQPAQAASGAPVAKAPRAAAPVWAALGWRFAA